MVTYMVAGRLCFSTSLTHHMAADSHRESDQRQKREREGEGERERMKEREKEYARKLEATSFYEPVSEMTSHHLSVFLRCKLKNSAHSHGRKLPTCVNARTRGSWGPLRASERVLALGKEQS